MEFINSLNTQLLSNVVSAVGLVLAAILIGIEIGENDYRDKEE